MLNLVKNCNNLLSFEIMENTETVVGTVSLNKTACEYQKIRSLEATWIELHIAFHCATNFNVE